MKKTKCITAENIMNYWLTKYHNVTVEDLIKNEPELIRTPAWYKKYAVSTEQHDEWYKWAITEICKERNCSRKYAERNFCFDYLNVAPNVIENVKQ